MVLSSTKKAIVYYPFTEGNNVEIKYPQFFPTRSSYKKNRKYTLI